MVNTPISVNAEVVRYKNQEYGFSRSHQRFMENLRIFQASVVIPLAP